MKQKETKRKIYQHVIGALGAFVLENLLTGKGVIRAGEDTITAGENFNVVSLLK